jgi:hypothetical protein
VTERLRVILCVDQFGPLNLLCLRIWERRLGLPGLSGRTIRQRGLVVTGYAGQVVAHPLVVEIGKCEETIRKCLSVLGISPIDRARLGLAEVKEETALQEFIAISRKNSQA